MDRERGVQELARVFAALGSPERLQLVRLLLKDEQPNCGDIACRLGMSAPRVSYHLRTLESTGLIQRVPHGRQRCVLLTPLLKELVRREMLRRLKGGS